MTLEPKTNVYLASKGNCTVVKSEKGTSFFSSPECPFSRPGPRAELLNGAADGTRESLSRVGNSAFPTGCAPAQLSISAL